MHPEWALAAGVATGTAALWHWICLSAKQTTSRRYNHWRLAVDVLLCWVYFNVTAFIGAYIVLRGSLCPDKRWSYRQVSDLLYHDPWVNQFPCSKVHTLARDYPGFWLNYKMMMKHTQPAESVDWLDDRKWWAVPYLILRYGFFQHGSFLLFAPGIVLFPLFLPKWWFDKGRDQWVVAWRLCNAIMPAYDLLIFQVYDRLHIIDIVDPIRTGTLLICKLGLSIPVQWPLNLKVVFAEGVLLLLVGLIRHQFQPTCAWICGLIVGVVVGGTLSTLVNCMEAAALPFLYHMWDMLWRLSITEVRSMAWRAGRRFIDWVCRQLQQEEIVVIVFYAGLLLVFQYWVKDIPSMWFFA